MSNHPSLSAALKRLTEWARWQQHDFDAHPRSRTTPDNPYAREIGRHNHIEDVALVAEALSLAADIAEHTDSADGNPIFTIKLPCSWLAANKGFLHALSQCRGKEVSDE